MGLVLENITLFCVDGRVDISKSVTDIYKALVLSSRLIKFGSVKYLGAQNITKPEDGIEYVHIPQMDYSAYSEFMIKKLANYISSDFMINIQSDGFILNPQLWEDEFLNYDYIGAPWWYLNPHLAYASKEGIDCKNNVGNGGFSLRSRKFIEESRKIQYDGYSPEDAFLCIKSYEPLINSGIKFAPTEVASKFSTEPYRRNSFGFHDCNFGIDDVVVNNE